MGNNVRRADYHVTYTFKQSPILPDRESFWKNKGTNEGLHF